MSVACDARRNSSAVHSTNVALRTSSSSGQWRPDVSLALHSVAHITPRLVPADSVRHEPASNAARQTLSQLPVQLVHVARDVDGFGRRAGGADRSSARQRDDRAAGVAPPVDATPVDRRHAAIAALPLVTVPDARRSVQLELSR
jgi:hypothetical protein